MAHLTETELVDLLDRELEAGRMRHLEACASCREQAEALGAALGSACGDQVPEPSPLFWEHFSARVADAIRVEPSASRWRGPFAAPWWGLATAAVLLLLVGGLTWQVLPGRDARHPLTPVSPASERTLVDSPGALEAAEFVDAWDALQGLAADLEWEEAQTIGIGSRPGSAEPMVGELTADERLELARLIEIELKRHGA